MGALNYTATSLPTSSAKSNGVGALSALDSDTYDFTTTRYPLTVGTTEVPHYVVFNINLPQGSKYLSNTSTVANVQSASQNNYDLTSALGGKTQASGGQALQAGLGGAAIGTASAISGGSEGIITSGVRAAAINIFGGKLQVKPKLQRIKKAIALYMPDTVAFQYDHGWQTASVTQAMGIGGKAAAMGGGLENIAGNIKDDLETLVDQGGSFISGHGFDSSKLKSVVYSDAQGAETVGTIAETLGAGSDFTALALKSVNKALNPQIEMVFQGTDNRKFQFTFDFQPRSSAESQDILDIIQTFRLYAAPELSNEGNGRYFIPPGQFDITFYFNNTVSLKIPKISTCALTNISVNYSAAGAYTTFTDGMPVHINLQLSFIEMDIITRELIGTKGY